MSALDDLDRRLKRAATRRTVYLAEGDHRSAEIELKVIDGLLDERATAKAGAGR